MLEADVEDVRLAAGRMLRAIWAPSSCLAGALRAADEEQLAGAAARRMVLSSGVNPSGTAGIPRRPHRSPVIQVDQDVERRPRRQLAVVGLEDRAPPAVGRASFGSAASVLTRCIPPGSAVAHRGTRNPRSTHPDPRVRTGRELTPSGAVAPARRSPDDRRMAVCSSEIHPPVGGVGWSSGCVNPSSTTGSPRIVVKLASRDAAALVIKIGACPKVASSARAHACAAGWRSGSCSGCRRRDR